MKNILFILFFIIGSANIIEAQEESISNGFSAGFHLNQYQNDFGMGLNITSPFFMHNYLAIRLRGNLMFNQHPENNETTWTPYSNVSLGVIGVGGKVGEHIRLYGEGGAIALFPAEEFSTETLEIGGYGLFGFEFYTYPRFNYFIEIGGIGTGAKADKIAGAPIYSNGLLISVGFRGHFK